MADVHDKETRSKNMKAIRSKDTRPEKIVRQFLYSNGFRYRKYFEKLEGKPDIVFPGIKTAIFIHGCFWHGHAGCKDFKMSSTNTDFWINKIVSNQRRDKKVTDSIEKKGWQVIIIWECELKPKVSQNTLENLKKQLLLKL